MNRLAWLALVFASAGPLFAQAPSERLGPAPRPGIGDSRSQPPPIPGPPAELVPPRPDPIPPLPNRNRPSATPLIADPFQETPRDEARGSNDLAKASAAFAARRFDQAALLYAAADRRHDRLTDAQRD